MGRGSGSQQPLSAKHPCGVPSPAPYSYSWNFGDRFAASAAQNPSRTYSAGGTYTATLTVTDSSTPAKTATSTVTITASPIVGAPPGAPTSLTAAPASGQATLNWQDPRATAGSTSPPTRSTAAPPAARRPCSPQAAAATWPLCSPARIPGSPHPAATGLPQPDRVRGEYEEKHYADQAAAEQANLKPVNPF
ncbi:PKD domain-containing protein [Streptacidiphilus sp. MAP12-16]|uniref:PKD domain-containing protein n=1 Tax=Streptacidiphilus sp. MAP12-16 TaxID=3156300 RepID=UPI003510FA4A